jgi:hypothetical protein
MPRRFFAGAGRLGLSTCWSVSVPSFGSGRKKGIVPTALRTPDVVDREVNMCKLCVVH